ncbi:hypothetical protein [Kitasatospora fiedleri]|uniref:hypothetical protein n=1 Tax=Kitasatospora fiedleri TaxID=2991545 RepID=UPI002989CA71|nr:hypothetical protein [Kitasatospora fiedleri]
MSPSWAHENAAEVVRRQPTPRLEELGLVPGSGTLDLPGSANWFIPDLAVVPLLVVRQQRECTVFSDPGRLGCAEVDGPHPFGSPVRLPAPFDPDPDTGRFRNRTRRVRPDDGGSGGPLRWGGVRSRQTHGRAGA